MADIKKILKDTNDAIAKIAEEKRQRQLDGDRKDLVNQINATIGPILIPYLQQMVENTKTQKGEMMEMVAAVMSDLRRGIKESLSNLKLDDIKADIKIPEIRLPKFPDIKVPEPKVVVNFDTSKIVIAPPVMPSEMTIKGSVKLDGVDLNHPLPVQLRDADGKPMKLFENLTTLIGGGGSANGKSDFFTIKGFSQSAYSEMMNADGRLKVSVETGGSGLTDTELRASSVPVAQASGAIWSTAVIDIFGSAAASGVINADNRIKVSVETGGSGLTDSELRASHLDVQQLSGAIDSVSVTGFSASVGATILNGEGLARDSWLVSDITNSIKAALIDSGGVQYSGSNPVPVNLISQSLASSASVLVDSSGVQYSGSNPVPITIVTGASSSVNASLIDSGGVGYSGSNPLPITGNVNVNGSLNSVLTVGPVVSDGVDDGSAPVKVGGIARTANPTAVSGGDSVSFSADKVGRQINRPMQVRDLMATAYVAVSTGTETTLLAASAGVNHDLVWVLASNNSTAAVGIDIRAVTAGNIVAHFEIPANSTVGLSANVGYPIALSDESGNNWTVDLPDVTGTTVYVSALFTKEI